MKRVARLLIAPVKSMGLVAPDEVRVQPFGVPENRAFYLVDEHGALVNGGKLGRLVQVSVDYDSCRPYLSLRFPGGTVAEGDPSDLGETLTTSFYGRPVRGRVVMGPWQEALSEFAGRSLRLVRPERSGGGQDSAPVSLFSTASADDLASRSGSAAPRDSRRFRMLVEVEGSGPYEEDGWVGRPVRLGACVVRVDRPVPRCVVTTQDPSSGMKDFDTLGAIEAIRGRTRGDGLPFGVYASVVRPGTIRVEDPVEVLDR